MIRSVITIYCHRHSKNRPLYITKRQYALYFDHFTVYAYSSGSADLFMNSHLAPENIAISVVNLRNSRAIPYNLRRDGNAFRHNLLRPE